MQVINLSDIKDQPQSKSITSNVLTAYRSLADINRAQHNPPNYVKNIHYPTKGEVFKLHKEQDQFLFVESTLEDVVNMRVICFPGIAATEKLNRVFIKVCACEVFNQEIYGKNYDELCHKSSFIGIYKPKYSAKERYMDLLEYYKNELYIGRESAHIAETILLPIIYHSHGKMTLLRTFSLGAHEVKMALNYAFEYMQADNYDELEIKNIFNQFIVINTGASINWQNNPLASLYPKILTVVSLEDRGIKHPWHTFQLMHAQKSSANEHRIIARDNFESAQEIIYLPPIGVIPISNRDHNHNLKLYSWFVQNTPILNKILQLSGLNQTLEIEKAWLNIWNLRKLSNPNANLNEHITNHQRKINAVINHSNQYILYDDGSIVHLNLATILHKFRPRFHFIHNLNPYDFNNYELISDMTNKYLTDLIPDCVLNEFYKIKENHPYRRKIIILHSCPTGSIPSLSHDDQLNFTGHDDYILQYFILGLAKLLGCKPIIDFNIQSGSIISNIYPKKSSQDKYNANSTGEFHYHNETTHKLEKPKLFILGCNNHDTNLNITTSFILTDDLLKSLPDNMLDIINEELFEFDGGDVVLNKQSYISPILKLDSEGGLQDFRLNLNPKRMKPTTKTAECALEYITHLISQKKVKQHDINFARGMVVIADNNASIHMRSAINNEYFNDDIKNSNTPCPQRLLYRIHLQ